MLTYENFEFLGFARNNLREIDDLKPLFKSIGPQTLSEKEANQAKQ